MKRPDKIKCDVIAAPTGLVFGDGRRMMRSLYKDKLQAAIQNGHVVRIAAGDAYMRSQFMQAAKKLGMKLLSAQDGQYAYLKPIAPSEAQHSLLMLLREPRTLDELRAKHLELDLNVELQALRDHGAAEIVKHLNVQKWRLTEAGLKLTVS